MQTGLLLGAFLFVYWSWEPFSWDLPDYEHVTLLYVEYGPDYGYVTLL